MITRNNNRNGKERRMIVRDGVPSSLICSYLRQEEGKIDELVIHRKRMDLVLAGRLHDILVSRDSWKLVELNGSSRHAVQLVDTLSHAKQVQRLIIQQPTDAIIARIGSWITNSKDCARIDSLSLRSATLSLECTRILKEGVLNLTTASSPCSILRLDVSHSSFPSLEAIEELGIALKHHETLEELCLGHCHLEDEEIAALMGYLIDHPTLRHLDLGVNFCQQLGTQALAQVLVSSTPIKALNLSYQDVWDDRCYFIHMASAISNPTCSLQVLDLSSNFLNDDHFLWLVLSLRDNYDLESLILHDNSITDVGIMAFAHSLSQLSLSFLDLTLNRFTTKAVAALEEGLASNTSLSRLKMDIPSTYVLYYLALNRGGRRSKLPNFMPLSLWPLVLERSNRCLDAEHKAVGISPADIIYDLLRGPALLER